MEMADLPRDVVEEILSKLPITCMRAVRLTCKKWNALSKTPSFVEKHIGEKTSREFSVIMMMNEKVYLMGINFSGVNDKFDTSIKRKGRLIMRKNSKRSEPLVTSRIFHGGDLLLFVMINIYVKGFVRLVVWNPYWGQLKWIQARASYQRDTFALGYEKKDKSHNHKILRIFNVNSTPCEIYDFKSDSWKVLTITPPEEDVLLYHDALPLKGNAYWVAREKLETRNKKFLICFDFTEERLGQRLSFPFNSYSNDIVILSSVREEQIAVLFKQRGTFEMKIWVTSKITPTTVSWSKFLEVDMRPFFTRCHKVFIQSRGFFIDKEKKVVVIINVDEDDYTRNVAYINGEDGYFRKVVFGEDRNVFGDRHVRYQHVRSYVPSYPFC